MNKLYLIIVFMILVSIGLSSCSPEDCMNSVGYNDCAVYTSCKVNEDCRDDGYCNVDSGVCLKNTCLEEHIDCGEAGKCLVDEHGETTCQLGYIKDTNMIAWGWQERGVLLDLNTEEKIGPIPGKVLPKGYGIP